MTTYVAEEIKIGKKKYPGHISADQDDADFLFSVLWEWAHFDPNEAQALIDSATDDGLMFDEVLREIGFDVPTSSFTQTGDMITLVKIGDQKWIVRGYSANEMEKFAKEVEGNIDPMDLVE